MKRGKDVEKTNTDNNITEVVKENKAEASPKTETKRVKFNNTCIGTYGNFYINKEYHLANELYETLKSECEVLN